MHSTFSTFSSTVFFSSASTSPLYAHKLPHERAPCVKPIKNHWKTNGFERPSGRLGGLWGLLGEPFGDPGQPQECVKTFFLIDSISERVSSKTIKGMHFGPPLGTLSGGPFPYRGRQNSSAGIGFEQHRPENGGSEKFVFDP